MKRFPRFDSVLCVVITAALAAVFVISYIGGTRNTLLPVAIIPLLLSFLLYFVHLFTMLYRLYENKSVLHGLLLLAVSTAAIALSQTVGSPSQAHLLGFRSYVLSRLSTEQLEAIAVAVEPETILTRQLGEFAIEATDLPVWNRLVANTEIERLGDEMSIYESDGSVVLDWGGGVGGSWGVRVAKTEIARNSNEFAFLPISSRIAVFLYSE